MTISEQILKRRKEIGMKHRTYVRLLEEAGIKLTRQTVHNWDNGRTQVNFEYHPKIEEILRFKLNYDIINDKISDDNGVHKN